MDHPYLTTENSPVPPPTPTSTAVVVDHPPCNDKCSDKCNPQRCRSIPAPVSLVMSCSGIMVAIKFSLSVQDSMGLGDPSLGATVDHKGMQLAILVFACLTFIVTATCLALVKPESKIHVILMQRIMHTQENWSDETLRSFTELWMWMSVNWCTYGVTHSVAISVACGTLAGIFSVLIGEYLSIPLHAVENYLRKAVADPPSEESNYFFTNGSMMVCVLYGYSVFSLLYENCSDILLAILVVSTAGACLLTVAKGLAMFQPTALAGELLSRRILETPENWKKHTMRSLLEASAWGAITLSNYAAYGDVIFAFKTGTLGGVLICLAGEYLTPRFKVASLPNFEVLVEQRISYWWRTTALEGDEAKKGAQTGIAADVAATKFSVMLTFTYTMGASLLLISGNKGFHWSMALVLSTLTGSAYIVAGKLFLSVPATHFIGTVSQMLFVCCVLIVFDVF